MPYIAQEDRKSLDPLIDKLAAEIVAKAKKAGGDASFAGFLNYTCTRLAMKIIRMRFGHLKYWIIASILGVFHSVADEFYRRIGIPYEQIQIDRNGDVDLFVGFLEDMRSQPRKNKKR